MSKQTAVCPHCKRELFDDRDEETSHRCPYCLGEFYILETGALVAIEGTNHRGIHR